MKRSLCVLGLIPLVCFAQDTATPAAKPFEITPAFFNVITPRQLGPTTMGGRIMDIAVYEKEPRIVYIASASGGLWKTENGGLTTQVVFDREATVSLGCVAVSQKDPNVVWVGTGEASSRNSTAWGDGVYKSTDGGKTWTNMGLKESMHIAEILIDPRNNDVVYVAALGRLWGENEERGVYKTTDGGKTWTKVLKTDNNRTGIGDLVMDPSNPNVLLAAAWERMRKAYDWTSGGPGSALYKTTDAGKTWKKITKGVPPSPLGRIGLAFYRKDPKMMVATIEYRPPTDATPAARTEGGTAPAGGGGGTAGGGGGGAAAGGAGGRPGGGQGGGGGRPGGGGQGGAGGGGGGQGGVRTFAGGTYVSKDHGDSWTKVNNLNPRPFYFSTPKVDPSDPQRIYVLGVSLHMSENGGETFRAMSINVHPDFHTMWIDPSDSNHMIVGCDGGVYQTRDRGKTWDHFATMPLGQYYAVAFDYRKPYWVYGGLQDNGSWAFPTQTTTGGPSFFHAYGVGGGDGFHVQVDPTDWSTLYSESQGGAITRIDQRTGANRFIRPSAGNTIPRPAEGERWRFNWSSPILISPHNPRTLYFGGNRLFKSVNRGDNWKVISPDLSTNDPTKMQPGKNSVTPEDTGAERHCTIITIAESPMRQGLLYVGTDDGNVWMSMDDGQNWNNLTRNFPDLPPFTWCSRVLASKYAEGRAYATFDGHRGNDFKPYVYVTEDYGKTWTSLAGGLPDNDSLYVIREGERNGDLLYLGSEMSLRFSLDRGKTWHRYVAPTWPTVAVHDVVVHPRELDLVVATHGRSVWIIPASGLEQLTQENLAKDVFLCKPQNVLSLGRVSGSDWDGDGLFVSPNTQPGTTIFYNLRAPAKADPKLVITDILGNSVAELRPTNNAGLNAVPWALRGRRLAAGDYRVTLTVDGKEYITSVQVENLVATPDVFGVPGEEQKQEGEGGRRR